MPKVKVTCPDGYHFRKEKHAQGDEIDHPAGANLNAALHFKQVEILKEKPTTSPDPEGGKAKK